MSFRRRARVRVFFDMLNEFAEATSRLDAEYKDIARSRADGTQAWRINARFEPMTKEQGKRFIAAFKGAQDVTVTRLPHNPEHAGTIEATLAAGADAAAAHGYVMSRVRMALHEANIKVDRFDVRVRPEGTPEPHAEEVTIFQVGGSDGPEVAFSSRQPAHEILRAVPYEVPWSMSTYPLEGPDHQRHVKEVFDYLDAEVGDRLASADDEAQA